MVKHTLYECEICHTKYAAKITAEDCEKSHLTQLKIVGASYKPCSVVHTGLPMSITILDESGHKTIYTKGKNL